MSKDRFITKRFSPETLGIIQSAEKILNDYERQGYDLSLRQLYYQFIAADLFPASWIDEEYNRKNGLPWDTKNTEKNYKNLGGIISDARLAGLLDWDMIKDRGRELVEVNTWKTPSQIILACANGFRLDLWKNQSAHVEVMVEKQALEGVLTPVCDEMGVAFMANKGYSSSSAMYEAGQRLRDAIDEGKHVHVIYLGDHDPSGIDMTRDVLDRIWQFARMDEEGGELNVHRIALNMDQVKTLRPPRNPAKITDSRAASYISRFGSDSWELDAIPPAKLADLMRKKIHSFRDMEQWIKDEKIQEAMKAELLALAKKSKFKDA